MSKSAISTKAAETILLHVYQKMGLTVEEASRSINEVKNRFGTINIKESSLAFSYERPKTNHGFARWYLKEV